MKIGVLSDTHDHLDPKIPALFDGVDHILHAGDIGLPWLILQLESIAPVTAVLGNTDAGLSFKETEILQLDGRKFLVHHIVDVRAPAPPLHRRIIRENPDVVTEMVGSTLYFNPGYAGRPRFGLERSVAILDCDGAGVRPKLEPL